MAHERARVLRTGITDTIYSDFKTGFSVHPVKGDLVLDSNENSVKRSIRNILLTNSYERPFNPTFGGNITALLFENYTPATVAIAKENITRAINNFEPRANIIDVVVSGDPDRNSLIIRIVFSTTNRTTPDTLDVVLERVR